MKFDLSISTAAALLLSTVARAAPYVNPQGFVQDPPLLGDYAGNGAFSGPGAVSGPTYDSASSESVPASLAQNTTEYQWNEGFQYNYYISSTCNTTNANLITIGQNQGLEVAQHARVFLLHYGNYSDTFIKYFGFSPSYAPLGVYDSIANGDRSHLLYTCEDVENKCSTIGHSGIYIHNPDNITICDKAYFNRLYNDQICTQGYTVDGSDPTTTVAGQYIEYLLSTGKFGGMDLHHYDDTYEGVLKLATTDPVKAQKNIRNLVYFALDIWAYDISVPGVGCNGHKTAHVLENGNPKIPSN